jgi:hypothetical protein
VSSRLITVLQTVAFPFRHCTDLASNGQGAEFRPPASSFQGWGSSTRASPCIGTHGRIRTRIFLPVTFVHVRSAEGYVGMEPLTGIDPVFSG